MQNIFKSSFLYGGNLINPEIIEFNSENKIVYKQNYSLDKFQFSVCIPIFNIIAIDVLPRIFGNKIIIKSSNSSDIIAKGFSHKQIKKIKSLIIG